MANLLSDINERSKLAGNNKLEVLLFSLGLNARSGRREAYGINVFKVREVMRVPEITRSPDMPKAVEGMVSMRGALVPVLDLVKYIGVQSDSKPGAMIVTEYNGQHQGLLVEAVDKILRLDWSQMHVPPEMLRSQTGGLVTAVTELPDKRLVMMMDVEKVLAETLGNGEDELIAKNVHSLDIANRTVFFADDSFVARKQIEKILDAMKVKYISAINGSTAWDELQRIAERARDSCVPVKNLIQVILTDVEMPEMDGYMLTKNVKADKRFTGIPVVMHSSLSGDSNHQLGKAVGVDEYVPKSDPQFLAQSLARLLSQ